MSVPSVLPAGSVDETVEVVEVGEDYVTCGVGVGVSVNVGVFLVFVLVSVDVSKFDVLTTKVEKEALLCDISAGEESSGLLGRASIRR